MSDKKKIFISTVLNDKYSCFVSDENMASSVNYDFYASRFGDITTEPYESLPPLRGYEKNEIVSLENALKPVKDFVPELDAMLYTARRNCKPSSILRPDEAAAIMIYSLEWTPEEQSFYYIFNNKLRDRNRRALLPWFLYIRLFVEALLKLPEQKPRILYRGVKKQLQKYYSEDKECTWWSFSSCTSSLKVLNTFIGTSGPRTIFNLHCRSAIDISEYSFLSGEAEFLLFPGRHFRCTSTLNAGDNLHIIELEEIEPPFCFFSLPTRSNPMNFVFLGRSDAGKRTLINALVNYWNHSDWFQALAKPVPAVVPMSFIFSDSETFHETNIKWGDVNNKKTSQCRTYQQEIVNDDGRITVNLIDTPSFDDDDESSTVQRKTDHIISFLKNYQNLNAICFVVKTADANLGTLPLFFQAFVTQVELKFLENIIFCFTNSSDSFYTAGASIITLRRMISQSRARTMQISRENTFIFENNAFRCLLIKKYGIELENESAYRRNYQNSVVEAKRLLDFAKFHQ